MYFAIVLAILLLCESCSSPNRPQQEAARPQAEAAHPQPNITTATFVDRCDPCAFVPKAGESPLELRFSAAHGVIPQIDVTKKGGTAQSLHVDGMTEQERFFIGGVDLNFDGYQDLILMTAQGTANANAEYWLYSPATSQFSPLGNYPVFRIDSAHNRLLSYERGGDAGAIYTKREYQVIQGRLTVLREELQEATQRPGVYTHIVRELRDGKMALLSRKIVRVP